MKIKINASNVFINAPEWRGKNKWEVMVPKSPVTKVKTTNNNILKFEITRLKFEIPANIFLNKTFTNIIRETKRITEFANMTIDGFKMRMLKISIISKFGNK